MAESQFLHPQLSYLNAQEKRAKQIEDLLSEMATWCSGETHERLVKMRDEIRALMQEEIAGVIRAMREG